MILRFNRLKLDYNRGLAIAMLLTAAIVAQGQEPVTIKGSGASFPAPLVEAMALHYQTQPGNRARLTYGSIGSGAGVRQFMAQEVMFAMTEAYLTEENMSEVEQRTGGKAFHIPVTLADVVVTYNIPGIPTGLILNGETLAAIFIGEITNWNDPRIKALNPAKLLPDLQISVIYRSDSSGTTNLFTNFLNAVSTSWNSRVGRGTQVNWPAGTGARGNEGVAEMVTQTKGAIGYNSFAFATLNNMSYAWLVNQHGNTIEPSFTATTEAAKIELPQDTRILFTNTTAPLGYPIAGFTWALVYENLDKNKAITSRETAIELVNFLAWAITEGQNLSEMLGYARLPQALVDKNLAKLSQLKWQGESIGRDIVAAMK